MAKTLAEMNAVIGMVTVDSANPNLDGSGELSEVISESFDMNIAAVIIKAIGTTTQGMVRLFIEDETSNIRLLEEISIPGNEQTSVLEAFQQVIYLDFYLQKGYKLLASTEKDEAFNIIAIGNLWKYPTSENQIIEESVNGMAAISTANSNLDGTGSLTTILEGSNNGNSITSIDVKAIESTGHGMVRLFFSDGVNTKLFWESSVPCITQDEVTATYHSNNIFNFILKYYIIN